MNPVTQALSMIEAFRKTGVELRVAAIRHIGRHNEEPPVAHLLPQDPVRLEKVLRWLKFENATNDANIWIRPNPSTSHPWLFIDDLAGEVARIIAMKYASIIVETSPGNFQCRLLSSQTLDTKSRRQVQSALVNLLNARGDHADLASTAGDKWGRLPGFRNRKPGRDCWTNLMLDTTTTSLKFDPTPYLSPHGGACASSVLEQKRTPVASSTLTSAVSDSDREFGWALNRLKFFHQKGFNVAAEAEVIRLRLIKNAIQRDKRNPEDYARRTIAAALRALG